MVFLCFYLRVRHLFMKHAGINSICVLKHKNYSCLCKDSSGARARAYEDAHAFKLYSFDVAVLRKMSHLSPQAYTEGNRLLTEFKGAISENYVLQSLLIQYERPLDF